MQESRITIICERFAAHNPDPKIELDYVNHYTLLVAIILSAQATDKGVNKATKALFSKVDNPYDMVELGFDGLVQYIKVIGLYNSKARHILGMSRIIIDNFEGRVPHTFADLMSLPGVGRKTANVFLNSALGMNRVGVDRHVARVSMRVGLSDKQANVENDLMTIVPEQYLRRIHHWLVLHGRYTCLALKPRCMECIISDLCDRYNK